MQDYANVSTNPNRPEIFVQSPIQPVEPQPRLGWVQLKVQDLDLGSLLLIASQFGEAIGESAPPRRCGSS